MRVRRLLVGAAALASTGIVAFGAALPAQAASGQVYSAGANARSIFNDQNDVITACDRSENGQAAVAFVRIRQADGSWVQKGWAVDGNANGENRCVSQQINVQREAAALRLYSCEIRNGVLNDCRYATLQGS